MKKHVVLQKEYKDCGVSCILSVLRYYNGNYPSAQLKLMTNTNKHGTTAFDIVNTLKKLNINSIGYKCSFEQLVNEKHKLPSIANVTIDKSYKHFVVIYKINKKYIEIMDPAKGMIKYKLDEFRKIYNEVLILIDVSQKLIKIDETSTSKFLFDLIFQYKPFIFLIVIISIIFTFFSILNTYYLKYIMDNIQNSYLENIVNISILFLVVIILKSITEFIRYRLLVILGEKINLRLMLSIYNHIITLPYNYFKSKTAGEFVERIRDISVLKDTILTLIVTFSVDLILLIGSLCIFYFLSSLLLIIVIIILSFYIIFTLISNNRLYKKYYNLITLEEKTSSNIIESINSFDTIKGMNIEKNLNNKFNFLYSNFTNKSLNFSKKISFINLIKSFIENFIIYILIFLGSLLILKNKFTLGDLVLIILLCI
ncbi:MAG: cysteine peptidase family C39 domain-containing protein [Bacilli bacterium]